MNNFSRDYNINLISDSIFNEKKNAIEEKRRNKSYWFCDAYSLPIITAYTYNYSRCYKTIKLYLYSEVNFAHGTTIKSIPRINFISLKKSP